MHTDAAPHQPRRLRTPQRRHCVRARGRDRDRGSVAAQTVIAIPVLILLPLLIVQVALWAFAAHAAQAAAAQALDAARVSGGTSSAGQADAQRVLNQLTADTLHGVHILVQRTGQTVTVTITGSTETIVPGLHFTVHAHASGPVETFTPDTP